jgi:hypothetical protein
VNVVKGFPTKVIFILAFCLEAYAGTELDAVGVWKGDQGGIPLVTVTIEQWHGKLTGAILFYLVRRESNGKQTASPGVPEPLLNVREFGNTLTFDVSHRNAHPPRTLNDPPVQFKLQVKDSKSGVLTGPESPPLQMTKDY